MSLKKAITAIAHPDALPAAALRLCLNELFQFFNKVAATQKPRNDQALVIIHTQLETIANRIDQNDFRRKLEVLLNKERQPIATYTQMAYYCSQVAPSSLDAVMSIPVYGDVWTKGYALLAERRMADDLYRSLVVEMVEPTLEQTIARSVNAASDPQSYEDVSKWTEQVNTLNRYDALLEKVLQSKSKRQEV